VSISFLCYLHTSPSGKILLFFIQKKDKIILLQSPGNRSNFNSASYTYWVCPLFGSIWAQIRLKEKKKINMCESFYVHYGFISSSYSMYTVQKLLLMLFYLETKPPEGRMSIKPQDIAIFSNSHLITEIFPRLITSSTKSKLSRSHKHVGWHLEELCIISQISAIETWRSSRLPPDEKKVEQTEAKRLTHAG